MTVRFLLRTHSQGQRMEDGLTSLPIRWAQPHSYQTLGVAIPADIYLKAGLCLRVQHQLESTQK